jgi:hypothetical protein
MRQVPDAVKEAVGMQDIATIHAGVRDHAPRAGAYCLVAHEGAVCRIVTAAA